MGISEKSQRHFKQRGIFGPAEKYLREGHSKEQRGMQEPRDGPRTRGGTEERLQLAQGSLPHKTVSEQLRQLIADREKARETEKR